MLHEARVKSHSPPSLLTARQFSEKHHAFTDLRWLIFQAKPRTGCNSDAESNGLESALVWIGRRVLMNDDTFCERLTAHVRDWSRQAACMMLVGTLSRLAGITNSKFYRQLSRLKLIAIKMITYINKQKVSPLFVDKISVTFKAEYSQHDSIKKSILQLVDDGYGWPVHRPQYSQSVNIDVAPEGGNAGTEMLLVQCEPKISCAFFRCEFNPARADVSLVRTFLDQVLAGGYKSMVQHGVCTRIDLTVDVYGAAIGDLLLWHPAFSKTSAYYKSGQIETYYLGTPFSPKQFCFYDKVAETKRKNKKRLIPDVLPPSPTTRLEIRIRNDSFVSELSGIGNPFEQLKVGSFGYPNFPADEKFTLFLEACRSRGTQDALLMLSESTRKKFRKIIEASQCAWWSPVKVWKEWPEVFKNISDPNAKTSGVQSNHQVVQPCG